MPKFNAKEMQMIRQQLYQEGEKLFEAHGLNKVTINDLTQAVNISHGSFYSFFENKEHLFMEISIKRQREIFDRFECLVETCEEKEAHAYAKRVLDFLRREYFADPIISSINGTTWERLVSRIPEETMEHNTLNDTFVVDKLIEAGLKFKCSKTLVVKTVQAVFVLASTLEYDEDREAIFDIILEGLIDRIVEKNE